MGSPRQDPCLRILGRVLAQHPCVRISYTGSMTAGAVKTIGKIYVRRSSRRSMPPDPCLSFHTCDSSTRCTSPEICLSALIHGPSARSMSQDTLQSVKPRTYAAASLTVKPSLRPCLSILYFIIGKIYVIGARIRDQSLRYHVYPK